MGALRALLHALRSGNDWTDHTMTNHDSSRLPPWPERPETPTGWETFCSRVLSTAGGENWPEDPVSPKLRRSLADKAASDAVDDLRRRLNIDDPRMLLVLAIRLRDHVVLQRWLGEVLVLVWAAAERGDANARVCMEELFKPDADRNVWLTPWYLDPKGFPELEQLGKQLCETGVRFLEASSDGASTDQWLTQARYAMAAGESAEFVQSIALKPGFERSHPHIPWDRLQTAMFERFGIRPPNDLGRIVFDSSGSGHRILRIAERGWGEVQESVRQVVLLREDMEWPPSHAHLRKDLDSVVEECREWLAELPESCNWLCTCYELGDLQEQLTFAGRWKGDPHRKRIPTLAPGEHDSDALEHLGVAPDTQENDEDEEYDPNSEDQIVSSCTQELSKAGVRSIVRKDAFLPFGMTALIDAALGTLCGGRAGLYDDWCVSFSYHQPDQGPAWITLLVKGGVDRDMVEFRYPAIA